MFYGQCAVYVELFPPMKTILNDESLMPFGKHKGEPMCDVPASYLHWLWYECGKRNEKGDVADYIRENLEVLKDENSDLIWDE